MPRPALAFTFALAFALVVAAPAAGRAQGSRQSAPAAPSSPAPHDFAARYAALTENRARLGDAERLRRLLALDWERRMVESPERATYVGYPGQNARWTDVSAAAVQRRRREVGLPLRAVRSIDRARLAEGDRLNYDLFLRDAEEDVAGARFHDEYMPITQLDGPQYLADVLALMPARGVRDYADMVARLDSIPRVVDQSIALMDSGLAAGITPPRVTLRDVPAQVAGLLADDPLASPLLRPFRAFPADVPAAERERLRAAAVRAYTERAAPAYRKLGAYLERTYLPGARESIAASALPDGAAWYAFRVRRETTTGQTPEQIHERGLAEVRRIRAEMDSVIRQVGFTGSFANFVAFLRTDQRFYYTDSASLVRAYRDIAKRIDPELTKLFGTLPRLPYGVVTIPSYQAKSQTTAYYQPGSPEAGRPGSYYVNSYALDTRPKWEMEALTAHESVPGHHLQIALAQELPGVPEFRRHAGYTAFVEGWGLYAESLGPELGLYADPYSKFGQLTYEMWRAIRLVLDTGIHSKGWTRQQAIDFFEANSAKTEHDIEVEVDRYIVWPGQALAYKTGELKIKELRAYARRELGDRFDVRAFHDEVLGAGALPLDVLEARVRGWVAERKEGGV
jgi:uncharacterized protein (DUF885 family)